MGEFISVRILYKFFYDEINAAYRTDLDAEESERMLGSDVKRI
jgi:hypothetical protein